MAKRRKSGRKIRRGRTRRIKIPKVRDRPLKLTKRDVLKPVEMGKESPWWFVGHRRGPLRPWAGNDPLEARAVPETRVRGTLPERIMLKALIELMHFSWNADFTFQSSLQGGRLELGGVVADFVFPHMKVIIRVQGPTHGTFIRKKKDDEQLGILEEMGYVVWDIDTETILNEYELEDWLRRKFGLYTGSHAMGAATEQASWEPGDAVAGYDWRNLETMVLHARGQVEWLISNA
jgi:hypothetical protein